MIAWYAFLILRSFGTEDSNLAPETSLRRDPRNVGRHPLRSLSSRPRGSAEISPDISFHAVSLMITDAAAKSLTLAHIQIGPPNV
jgi:hypothetical protein